MDEKAKRAIALWRLSVLGPLISTRLEHGDRQQHLEEIAARTHRDPIDDTPIQCAIKTLEAWLYQYRAGGFEALYPRDRSDRGRSRAIAPEIGELILKAKRERPRRSIRRIIKMLERAKKVHVGELSKSAVHRFLKSHRASARPVRGPATERRSFIRVHASDLWVGDALHGPLAIFPDGGIRKAYLLSQIDDATRYIVHSYFTDSEDAAHEEYGLKQAVLKFGIAGEYYVDRGPAYIAASLVLICAELGMRLLHAGAGDAEAKGVIERWHRTWRDEVGDELPDHPLPIAELNAKHWAWLGAEYHARKHETTGRCPGEHWLSEVELLRTPPKGKKLDEVFLHREERTVRKDGTVRFGGGFLEVRPELVGEKIELRFDPLDEQVRPKAFVDNHFASDTVPLDRIRNSLRKRRRIQGDPEPTAEPSGLDPLALIEAEYYDRVRPLVAPPKKRDAPVADAHTDGDAVDEED
jgi:transposase InsO family protein